ncbi:hypothetical protein [Pseudomonas costantinii]|uniref:Uncharacterized protein n=1 Tax=Pseudomonas costantinii TaxID=168469 RepID=A0A1S2USH0_9PSED|nr:hypothetical protein [Pseudomonas costantinii]NVZ19371.1 hypothetical protein [Pseudomonas costantinii]OIN49351.1 hypothetical protein BFL40_21620 [Pseudomonas costantinii]SEE15731.1 hypothetical protein SAMN04515675_4207 [Pseudomonas costantinii]
MNNDARVLDGLYREQVRNNNAFKKIEEDISLGGGDEDLSRLFDELLQNKISHGKTSTVTSAYVNYRHALMKSAINVV